MAVWFSTLPILQGHDDPGADPAARISDRFPQQTTLWLGGWSYTDGKGHQGVTQANRTAFIQHLREHFVNCPWATSG